jgi:regulator of protease activity HflC (stomatin/prohibitin superfamily)
VDLVVEPQPVVVPRSRRVGYRACGCPGPVSRSVRVVQQFEQGIVFRSGTIQWPPRGAGLTMIRPAGDRMPKVSMQIIAMAVPAQDGITRDNVTVRVDAVVYFRVVDPSRPR